MCSRKTKWRFDKDFWPIEVISYCELCGCKIEEGSQFCASCFYGLKKVSNV